LSMRATRVESDRGGEVHSRWRKRDVKKESKQEAQFSRRIEEPLTANNFGKACDDAVASFLGGDVSKFKEITSRLETLKVGTVRSLLNQEHAKL